MLLFDGECGLCQGLTRVLLRLDRRGRLHYAPLQSAAAAGYLRRHGLPTEDFDTLVFVTDWHRPDASPPRLRTDGALAALAVVGGIGRVLATLRVVPAPVRDLGYRAIARTRYALFGRYRPRPLARPEWAQRFVA